MRDFLESSTEINSNIKHLNTYTDELRKYTLMKQNSVLTEAEDNALDKKIDAVNGLFTDLSTKVKAAIRMNQKVTTEMRKKDEKKTVIEMRELHMFRHGRDLSDALRNYQNVQCDYKDREKGRLKETFLIANPEASDKDLESLTDTDRGEALLASAFALGSHSAQGILSQAKNRRRKIEKIVEMINILIQLIEDIDKLVKKSTHVVDEISVHMITAEEHTVQANKELEQALYYERKALWLKRLVLLIAILGVVGLIIWVFHSAIKNAASKAIKPKNQSKQNVQQSQS